MISTRENITPGQRFPDLSREEEMRLALRWRQDRDDGAANALARANLRHVLPIALSYRRYGVPLAELVAEGNFGIVRALQKFDPERGNRFVTYASHWIRACMVEHIIRSWSLVGVGSGALRSKLFFKLRREKNRLSNLVGDGDRAHQMLAEQFGVAPSQLSAMLRQLEQRDLSLDLPVHEDSATSLVDTLPATEPDQSERLAGAELAALVRDAVRAAVEELDPRERYIVERRIMADAEDELSLAEIGRRLGVSRERARQIEARAKRKLRRRLSRARSARSRPTTSLWHPAPPPSASPRSTRHPG